MIGIRQDLVSSCYRFPSGVQAVGAERYCSEERHMTRRKISMDKSRFVGSFCCFSGKGLCLLVQREGRHAKR